MEKGTLRLLWCEYQGQHICVNLEDISFLPSEKTNSDRHVLVFRSEGEQRHVPVDRLATMIETTPGEVLPVSEELDKGQPDVRGMVRHGKHEFLYVGPGFFTGSLDIVPNAQRPVESQSRLLLCSLEGDAKSETKICFAVNKKQVVEVIDLVAMSAIPEVRGRVRGYIERQGAIIPVVDISACLGLKPVAIRASARLVVARGTKTGQLKALLADDAIRTISPTGWTVGESRFAIEQQLMRGVFHNGQEQMVVPDLDLLP